MELLAAGRCEGQEYIGIHKSHYANSHKNRQDLLSHKSIKQGTTFCQTARSKGGISR